MEIPPRVSSSNPACDAIGSVISSALFTLSSVDSIRYETRCGAVINVARSAMSGSLGLTEQKFSTMEQFACSGDTCQRNHFVKVEKALSALSPNGAQRRKDEVAEADAKRLKLERSFENGAFVSRVPLSILTVCPLPLQPALWRLSRLTTRSLIDGWPKFSITPRKSLPTRVMRELQCATSRV